jgi:hypothetical protein
MDGWMVDRWIAQHSRVWCAPSSLVEQWCEVCTENATWWASQMAGGSWLIADPIACCIGLDFSEISIGANGEDTSRVGLSSFKPVLCFVS